MLALAKKNDCAVYNPGAKSDHFLNDTTNCSLAQVKLCLTANSEKYAIGNDNVMTSS